MKSARATTKAIIVFIIFLVLLHVLPSIEIADDINLILTVSTFLFAIIAGFYMSRLNTRYNRIIEAITNEDAAWVSLYETSKLIDEDFNNKVREIIDNRYILAYDYPLSSDYKISEKYLVQIYDLTKSIEIKDQTLKEVAVAEILDLLILIEIERNSNSVIGIEKLNRGQWTTVISLAVIIIFSLFVLKGDSIYSPVITSALATVTLLVLFVMKDLQDLNLGSGLQVGESGQEVFDHI